MNLRKKAIGDMYLAASILFIFLSFLHFGLYRNYNLGWTFLIIGLLIAFFGMKTKNVMGVTKVRSSKKKPKKSKKARSRKKSR